MEVLEKIRKAVMGYKSYASILAMLVISILENESVLDAAAADEYMSYAAAMGGAAFVAKLNRWMQVSAG